MILDILGVITHEGSGSGVGQDMGSGMTPILDHLLRGHIRVSPIWTPSSGPPRDDPNLDPLFGPDLDPIWVRYGLR